jgi:nitroreductase
MTFLDLVRARYSLRRYDATRPVERDKLDRCLEAARLAPSASNAQPWRFIVVDEPVLRERVARATFGALVSFNHFSLLAPVLVVCVAEERSLKARIGGFLKGRRYSGMDMGIAAEHFCLQATEEGLGTCMLGWFDEHGLRRVLKIPSGKRIGLVITVGYAEADSEPRARTRKSLDEIRGYNRY